MTDSAYNGWTNHPTWCVNMWLTNDQGLDDLVRERTAEIFETCTEDGRDPDDAIYLLATWLSDELCEAGGEYGLVPELEGFPSDLLGWALQSVNWREIAGHFVEEEREA